MADETPSKPPFWSSLPGMLTGLGAVIVAITGLVTALYTTGVIGAKASADTKAPPTNTVAALASTPAPDPEADRYKGLSGAWEVVEAAPPDIKNFEKVVWHFDATVSGKVLTLTGKIISIGGDKNLEEEDEAMVSSFVTTLTGSNGLGEFRVKDGEGMTTSWDATIKVADDLRQFNGRIVDGSRIRTLTGHKL